MFCQSSLRAVVSVFFVGENLGFCKRGELFSSLFGFMADDLDKLVKDIRACKICLQPLRGKPLPHSPRPVLQVSKTAKLAICGQAPGTKVHISGRPFTDRSGERLRDWIGLSEAQFYDTSRVAIVPMGFCFPGQTEKGADLPPRPECRGHWHDQLMPKLDQLELMLVIGRYAIDYHLNVQRGISLNEVVADYKRYLAAKSCPLLLPLPHPSWRNTGWLNKNPWFETAYLPKVRAKVKALMEG